MNSAKATFTGDTKDLEMLAVCGLRHYSLKKLGQNRMTVTWIYEEDDKDFILNDMMEDSISLREVELWDCELIDLSI